MNKLFENGSYGAISLQVDNGGWRRMDEYSPWYNAEFKQEKVKIMLISL
ncbi:MAG: hypothetical protein R2784_09080 [Saprospiraceae bacterium]